MKLSEKDLRIGNLVYRDGEIDTITGIWHELSDKISEVDYYVQASNKLDYSIKNIKSIPINEEWLIKLGWIKWKENTFRIHWGRNGVEFISIFPDGDFYYETGRGSSKHIHSVHQLQNFHFDMTEHELEFIK